MEVQTTNKDMRSAHCHEGSGNSSLHCIKIPVQTGENKTKQKNLMANIGWDVKYETSHS